jgi:hypothetical protein
VETNPSATTGLHGGLAPQVPAPNNKHPPKTYLGHSSNKQIFKLFFVCSGFLHRPGENAVNVKLTMRFRITAGLLSSAHSISRGSLQAPRDGYTGGVKQIWSSCGEGWGCCPGTLRERSAQTREGFLRALPSRLRVRVNRAVGHYHLELVRSICSNWRRCSGRFDGPAAGCNSTDQVD